MPTSVKGVCANHVPQVAKFFSSKNISYRNAGIGPADPASAGPKFQNYNPQLITINLCLRNIYA